MRVLLFTITLAVAVYARTIENDPEELVESSWVGDWLKRWKDYLTGRGGHPDAGKQCQNVIQSGGIPSAENGDSPLKQFGYTRFNEGKQQTVVFPGVTLSNMFGSKNPIKVGSRDYVVAGFPNELMAFFDCFKDYEIIGKSLGTDGSWTETGPVLIQLQNLNPSRPGGLQADLWEMLFKISMDRFIKYLNPVKIIEGMDAKIFGGKSAFEDKDSFAKMLEKVKEWLPAGEKFAAKAFELFKKPCPKCTDKDEDVCKLMKLKCLKDKGSELIAYWKAEEARLNEIRKQWIGWDDVSKQQKIMLTITMYAKPEHGVRATFNTGKTRVKVGDLVRPLLTFFDKKKN